MCLAVPGEIISIAGDEGLARSGDVRFGEAVRQASLAFVPEAAVGDYVLVHAGIAIAVLQEEAARRTFSLLDELE